MNRFEQKYKRHQLGIFHKGLWALYPETLHNTHLLRRPLGSRKVVCILGLCWLCWAEAASHKGSLARFCRSSRETETCESLCMCILILWRGKSNKRNRRGLRLGVHVFRLEVAYTGVYCIRGQNRRQASFGSWKPCSHNSLTGDYRSGKGGRVAVTLRNVERCQDGLRLSQGPCI